MSKQNITIIGGGPASLMLACSLDENKYTVSIYEKNAALGRKFLVAGKGGFNLTYSENIEQLSERYIPKEFMSPFLTHFTNTDYRDWLKSIGIETYVGTSKRVFPVKGIKPIEVLKAIEKTLEKNHVSVVLNHTWKGWKDSELVFLHHDELKQLKADIVVFALGGASWKVTGSEGDWLDYFKARGIETIPFYPSNCAFQINWNTDFIKRHQGAALKNCEFRCGDMIRKGEAVITQFGIEGSGIYPLSAEIRKELVSHAELVSASHETLNPPDGGQDDKGAKLYIDLKPDLSLEEIISRLKDKGKLSVKDALEKKINLTDVQIDLLKMASSKEEYNDVIFLSQLIKNYPLTIVNFADVDEAISTVGGISIREMNDDLEFKKLPNHYGIGEMLDWDAPTGGYLLQGCFSMGKFLADTLNLKN